MSEPGGVTAAVELHDVVAGLSGAPTVVLLPALGSTLEMWDPLAPALAEHLRVVRLDLRGHGRSPVPPGPYALADLGADVLALLDRLGLERAHLAGVSLGGMVAMWLAEHAAERVDRVVLCSTSAAPGPPEQWAERAATVRAHGPEAIAGTVVGRWLTQPFAAAHPGAAARLRAMVAATPTDGYAAACAAIEHMDVEAGLGTIRAPTLVIAAAQDTSIPPEHGRAVAAAIPGARFELVDPGAHLVAWERPEPVAALMREHLGR